MAKPKFGQWVLLICIIVLPCFTMGAFRNAFEDAANTVSATTGTFTGAVTAGTLTDGTLSISSGTITGGVAATFSGQITGGNISDGTAYMQAGGLHCDTVDATSYVYTNLIKPHTTASDLALQVNHVSYDISFRNQAGTEVAAIDTSGNMTLAAVQASGTVTSAALTVSGISTLSGGYCDGAPITISADTTLTTTMHYILVDASANDVTLTLPAVAGVGYHAYEIKVITDPGAHTITIDGNASETIDGATTNTTLFANQWDAGKIKSGGTQWLIW